MYLTQIFTSVLFIITFAKADNADCVVSYTTCIEKAAEDQRKIPNGPTEEQLEITLAKCFADNSCSKPDADAHASENDSKRKERVKIDECKNRTIMNRKTAIEKCVQYTYSDFKLKNPIAIANGSKLEPVVRRNHYLDQIKQKCQTSEVEKTKKCIATAFFSAGMSQKVKKEREKLDNFCKARETCQSSLSADCKTKLKREKEELCHCELMQDSGNIESDYQKCFSGSDKTNSSGKTDLERNKLNHILIGQINRAFCYTDESVCDQPKMEKIKQNREKSESEICNF